jgi:hypothetical protein
MCGGTGLGESLHRHVDVKGFVVRVTIVLGDYTADLPSKGTVSMPPLVKGETLTVAPQSPPCVTIYSKSCKSVPRREAERCQRTIFVVSQCEHQFMTHLQS